MQIHRKKSFKPIFQFLILLSIGFLLAWLSIKSVWGEKEKIIESFINVNYFWIAISILIAILSHYLRAFRWNYLLKPLGFKVKPFNAFGAVLVGYFANYGIPRMGEITRCTLVSKYDKVPFEVALGTVITERIVDTLLLLVIFFLTLFAQFSQLKDLTSKYLFDPFMLKLFEIKAHPLKLIILIVSIIFIFLIFYLFRKKISDLFNSKFKNVIIGFGKGISSIKDIEKKIQFVLLSLAIWACYFYSLYVCFFAFTGTRHLGQAECLVLILFGTFGVVFSPGGLGAYPAIVSSLLIFYGVEKISAFAFPWMVWSSQFILIVILGLISLIILPIINKEKTNVISR
ncbi:MAG: lysylphosphatidylglycerol synthase transmembrane domain-containing protein [Bacteroidota bacterium]